VRSADRRDYSPQQVCDPDKCPHTSPPVNSKSEAFRSSINQRERKRIKTGHHPVSGNKSGNSAALTTKPPVIEENMLEPSPMGPSGNKKTPSPDPTVTNVTNEAANKPSSGSGLRARYLIDLFLCSAMVLILVMVSPTLTRAAPVPELVIAKMLEHTKERNAVQNFHPRIETETISPQTLEDFIAADVKVRSIFPIQVVGRS
jgi:hypothetical protein